MNKGFFVVFLGIILGAMALIFINQTPGPTVASVPAERAGSAASRPEAGPTAIGMVSRPLPTPEPAPVRPEAPKPEAPVPTPPKPEIPASAPGVPEPDVSKPAAPAPEVPAPGVSKPVMSVSEPLKPAIPAPEIPKPEAPKPEVVKPEAPRPEAPKPEAVKPEAPKPEPLKPADTVMQPVTSTPETQVNPGGVPTKKSLTMVNIGLHFKGGGMALRIEADAPFSYKTFALSSPDRYVVDLVGTWNNLRAPTVPSNNIIKGARAGKQAGGPRLVLDMARPPRKHNVTWVTPKVLEITIE